MNQQTQLRPSVEDLETELKRVKYKKVQNIATHNPEFVGSSPASATMFMYDYGFP